MAEILNRILTGDLSAKSGGFLLRLPHGYRGHLLVEAAIVPAYSNLSHPDLHILDPEKQTISVDDIRGLRNFMSTSPMAAKKKTLIVIAADRMNKQAANAFLKSLEEPTSRTRIILLTDRPWALPATVLSRCLKSAVEISTEDLAAELTSNLDGETAASDIDAALKLCHGNPKAAAEVIRFNLQEWHRKAIEWVAKPTGPQPAAPGSGKDAPALQTLLELLQQSILDSASGDKGVEGWSEQRSDRALVVLNKMSRGIGRPGLDWKTRLAATLSCLAYAEA